MRRLAAFSALSCALVLGACSHNLYLTGRTHGATGTAKVSTGGKKGGDLVIALAGKEYRGRWVYMAQGGGVTFGSATAYSGLQSATVSGTAIALPSGGNGSITASAADGSSLRCNFDYSEMSGTGLGACQDNSGEMYDLQIN